MAKNIVICSDGTGNRGGKTRGTNVWRIFNAVDRYSEDCEQITYYDDGVGTDNVRLMRLFSGAFGWGLSRKIREAYEFLALNYEEGDKVFLFGFSRGAFTVRSLAGMICRCGLLKRNALVSLGRRKRKCAVNRILKAYRSEKKICKADDSEISKIEQIRNGLGIGDLCLRSVKIHFVGVWDTVDAIAGPLSKLKVVDWIYRHLLERRKWGFHDQIPHRDICNAYQALALDDERKTFHPNVWALPNNALEEAAGVKVAGTMTDCKVYKSSRMGNDKEQVIEQVWFAGAHSNVGGGYPKDSLSLVPLLWMMYRADACELRFLESKWQEYREAADPHGRLYDSRTGLGAFYRYAPRNLYEFYDRTKNGEFLPVIHKSVSERIERATDYYAPKNIQKEKVRFVVN